MTPTQARIRALATATPAGTIRRSVDAPNDVLSWLVRQRLTDCHFDWTENGRAQYGIVSLNERGRALAELARETRDESRDER